METSNTHRGELLADVLRALAPQTMLPNLDPLGTEAADHDPLTPEGLAEQTERLVRLIQQARDQRNDPLLRSLRRELLLTRWALAQLGVLTRSQGQKPRSVAGRADGNDAIHSENAGGDQPT